ASTWQSKSPNSKFSRGRSYTGCPFSFSAQLRYDTLRAMTTTLLHVGKAITPTSEIHSAGILVRDGEIERVGKRDDMELPAGATEIRSEDSIAIPGFIDVHIHGAGGRDVMEGSSDALRTITQRVAAFGTTSIVATTVTASTDDTLRAIEGVSKYIPGQ